MKENSNLLFLTIQSMKCTVTASDIYLDVNDFITHSTEMLE